MTVTTVTTEKKFTVDRISYGDFFNKGRSGAMATFVPVSPTVGVKLYRDEDTCRSHYAGQADLADCDLAPECWDCSLFTFSDGSTMWGYYTEIAEVACDIDWDEYGERCRSADREELRENLACVGYEWEDDHSGNWGYSVSRGNAVLIDCPGY